MSEETPDKHSSSTGWVVGVVVALIFYILSPGPVVLLIARDVIKTGSTTDKTIDLFFWPLIKLIENVQPVRSFYGAYFNMLGMGAL